MHEIENNIKWKDEMSYSGGAGCIYIVPGTLEELKKKQTNKKWKRNKQTKTTLAFGKFPFA